MSEDNYLQLKDKSVLISGADSGIGKAVALLFAKESADIAIIYHSDDKDAEETETEIGKLGRKAIIISGDINNFCFWLRKHRLKSRVRCCIRTED